MKLLHFLFLFLFCNAIAVCQSAQKKNAMFIELGGNGLFTSINFDHQFSKKLGWGMRAGIGFYSLNPFELTIPVGINYLFEIKENVSFMEIGVGITYTKADVELYVLVENKDPNYKNTKFFNYIPSISYRRHVKNSFLWKLGLTPVINKNGFIPFFGFSIGKLLK